MTMLLTGTGGGASFTPASLTNYYADFDGASHSAAADADPITTWTDTAASIAVTQGTAASKPTKQTASNGGKSFTVVRFDGSDDWLASAGTISHGITSGDWAVIVIAKITNVVNANVAFCNGEFAPSFYVYSSQQRIYDGGFKDAGNSPANGTWYWLVYERNGGNYNFYLNGTQSPSSPACSFNWSDAKWEISSESAASAANPFGGDIARIIVCKNKLSASDLTNMGTYCTATYGI